MPLVRIISSVAGEDFEHHPGDEDVEMSPIRAQQAVAAGWGELVRGAEPETPEAHRAARPETAEGRRARQVRRRIQ